MSIDFGSVYPPGCNSATEDDPKSPFYNGSLGNQCDCGEVLSDLEDEMCTECRSEEEKDQESIFQE